MIRVSNWTPPDRNLIKKSAWQKTHNVIMYRLLTHNGNQYHDFQPQQTSVTLQALWTSHWNDSHSTQILSHCTRGPHQTNPLQKKRGTIQCSFYMKSSCMYPFLQDTWQFLFWIPYQLLSLWGLWDNCEWWIRCGNCCCLF